MKTFLALCLLSLNLQVLAQDAIDPQVVQGLNIEQERAKLEDMRNLANAEYSAAKKACYQKIAVTPCLDRARQTKLAKDNEHKRLNLVLNDAERKQRGVNALNRTEEKQSPEKQSERDDERADRLKQQSETLERNVEKNEKQQEKFRDIEKSRDERAKHVQEVLDRQQKHKDKLKESAQSRANYQRKLDEAQQHRAQVQKDSESRNPPAAPLPTGASTSP
jgi:hypothetical protein